MPAGPEPTPRMADVKQAQAKVDQAALNLSYTHITAPTPASSTKRTSQVGANLSIGQDLLHHHPARPTSGSPPTSRRPSSPRMHPGQDVTIEGRRSRRSQVPRQGQPDRRSPGSRLSLFPPENATGNYVKVVQRIPVRIDFTKACSKKTGTTPCVRACPSPLTSRSSKRRVKRRDIMTGKDRSHQISCSI